MAAPPPHAGRRRLDPLVEGFDKLKLGSLLVIISLVIMGAAAVYSMVGFMGPGFMGGPDHEEKGAPGPHEIPFISPFTAFTSLAASTLSFVLGIAGWILLMTSAGRFAEYDRVRYGKGVTATRMVAGGLLALILGVFLAISGAVPAALALVVVGLLAFLIGNIVFALFVSDIARLRSEDGLPVPDGFRTAGILLLVGAILYIPMVTMALGALLQIIAIILIYVYSKEAMEALRAQAMRPPVATP